MRVFAAGRDGVAICRAAARVKAGNVRVRELAGTAQSQCIE